MTEQLRQSLSAALDDEADAFELRRVLDELDRDPELRATWDRYHLIGSVIRGERTVRSRSAARELAKRVPLAIRESAPAANAPLGVGLPRVSILAHSTGRGGAWRRMAAGLAVAASILVAAAIVYLPSGTPATSDPFAIADSNAAPVDVPVAVLRSGAGFSEPRVGFSRNDPRIREASLADLRRARAYMIQHAQQQGLEQRGVMSLVKMATYESP